MREGGLPHTTYGKGGEISNLVTEVASIKNSNYSK